MLMGLSTHLVASMAGCVALHVSDVSPVVGCVCVCSMDNVLRIYMYIPDLHVLSPYLQVCSCNP